MTSFIAKRNDGFCSQFCIFISFFVVFSLISSSNNVCCALKCPCNIGPCPSLGNNASIVDACTRTYSHAYCVRTVNLTIEDGIILKKRDIYRCANFSTAKHDAELMIHIPVNSSDQVTIEYRCRNQDYCSLEHLQDDDCDAAAWTMFGRQPGDDTGETESVITSEEIRNLQPEIQKPTRSGSDYRSCRCVDMKQVGKKRESPERYCRWTNDVRRDSGRNLPYCRNGNDPHSSSSYNRPDLRASIFCRGIDPSLIGGGQSLLKDVALEKDDALSRRFRCNFLCNYADRCNHPEEFAKIYCAAMRQLSAISKNEPLTFYGSDISGPVFGGHGSGRDLATGVGGPESGKPPTNFDFPNKGDSGEGGSLHRGEAGETALSSTAASMHVVRPAGSSEDEHEVAHNFLTASNHANSTRPSVSGTVAPNGVVQAAGHNTKSGATLIKCSSFLTGLVLASVIFGLLAYE